MAEATIKIYDTYININMVYMGVIGKAEGIDYDIRSFEAVNCLDVTDRMSKAQLDVWDREQREWKVRVRHNNAGVLSRRKVYKGIKSVMHDLNTKQPETELPKIEILRSRVIYPTFGSKHIYPTGSVYVTDGVDSKWVDLKEEIGDNYYAGNYITFKRKRYYLKNEGSYMASKFVVDVDKTLNYRNDKSRIGK